MLYTAALLLLLLLPMEPSLLLLLLPSSLQLPAPSSLTGVLADQLKFLAMRVPLGPRCAPAGAALALV